MKNARAVDAFCRVDIVQQDIIIVTFSVFMVDTLT